jgi:glycosyltransferase involved in cell wall biosynthesis
VLFVEHTSQVSGGQRSLLDLLEGLDGEVQADLAIPAGPLAEMAARRGISPLRIRPAHVSFRPHPVETPRGLGELLLSGRDVWRVARRVDPDVVHANSVRAGLIAMPAAAALRRPLVVHVRDCLPASAAAEAVRRVLAARADRLLCISRHVAEPFDGAAAYSQVRVVDNPIDLVRFDPSTETRRQARAALGYGPNELLVTLVGQITPWKGQREAIRVIDTVRKIVAGVRLLVIGAPKFVGRRVRYDNVAYMRQLKALVRDRGLQRHVSWLAEREDVPRLMRAADVTIVPSWEEPFGRVVVEAMAMGTPVIATSVGGPAEVITSGIDGLLVDPHDHDAWVAALVQLLRSPERRGAIGGSAAQAVRARFGRERHAAQVVGFYRELTQTRRLDPGRRVGERVTWSGFPGAVAGGR